MLSSLILTTSLGRYLFWIKLTRLFTDLLVLCLSLTANVPRLDTSHHNTEKIVTVPTPADIAPARYLDTSNSTGILTIIFRYSYNNIQKQRASTTGGKKYHRPPASGRS